jgi:hypothetical protein
VNRSTLGASTIEIRPALLQDCANFQATAVFSALDDRHLGRHVGQGNGARADRDRGDRCPISRGVRVAAAFFPPSLDKGDRVTLADSLSSGPDTVTSITSSVAAIQRSGNR